MQDQTMLRVRFPFQDGIPNIVARAQKFEVFFYNVFHFLRRRNKVVSFELALVRGALNFYLVLPTEYVASITSFLFTEFPDAEVEKVTQYDEIGYVPSRAAAFHPKLIGSESYILRTPRTVGSDPLSSFFNLLSDLSVKQAVFYQMLINPIDETREELAGGGVYGFAKKEEITEVNKPRFKVTMRLIFFAEQLDDLETHQVLFENVFSAFSTEHNRIAVDLVEDTQAFVNSYFAHSEDLSCNLNTEEVAAFFHYPDPEAKVRGVNWLFSRKAEPPMNLPTLKNTDAKEISVFGVTNFRGKEVEFGIAREDRRRHLYVVGKSGVGKSRLLEKLIADDIKNHKGVCVIDPHGDLIQSVLYHVPESRIEDVVYFNPADIECPIAFNPLDNVAREFKQQVTQGLIEIFKKFFGADWSPKIEHVFRFTVLALLDFKKATILSMQKMLTDRPYRQMVIAEIQDHVVKKFWANEFSSWSEKFDNEAIVPLVNKLGQFLSNEMVRNIVAQQKNKVDFDDIMNRERILLVELSKGKLGEENSSLLGSLLITKIEQQGMARAFVSQGERKDFYLYVDEFQNFATKTFDNILSEARKYRLDLTISHQYLGQLMDSTRETVFGNVGSIITFRLGADDSAYISKELAPRFMANDVMNLGVREMYLKMSIGGLVTPAFSARTVDVPDPDPKAVVRDQVIAASRRKFCTPIADVEAELDALDALTAKPSSAATPGSAPGAAQAAAPEEEQFEAPLV
ncbi:MAG: type IV secretory system conjugative DNA transfer family protein [bacterium]